MKNNNIKMIEIRDRATCIPALAIRMLPCTEDENFLMKKSGYGFLCPCVMLVSIEAPWHSARSSDEWQERSPRTMTMAHKYIEDHFEELKPCEVIDVEFILNEVEMPCKSLRQESIDEMTNILKEQADDEEEEI